jgi:hypothetical protein
MSPRSLPRPRYARAAVMFIARDERHRCSGAELIAFISQLAATPPDASPIFAITPNSQITPLR